MNRNELDDNFPKKNEIPISVTGTTWGCVGVASKTSVNGGEEIRTERNRTKRVESGKCCRRKRRRGSRESVGAGAVGDVRLAPASRLG